MGVIWERQCGAYRHMGKALSQKSFCYTGAKIMTLMPKSVIEENDFLWVVSDIRAICIKLIYRKYLLWSTHISDSCLRGTSFCTRF